LEQVNRPNPQERKKLVITEKGWEFSFEDWQYYINRKICEISGSHSGEYEE
jgi:hypothetical protein